ncbi:MAG: PSD1 domain-containing protein [Planctomycetes bacterium]|nr:PSD1 domain-containing protein [Planctomycetota bacterium]
MARPLRYLLVLALSACSGQSSWAQSKVPTPAEVEFFENQVRPLLVEHCFSCHGRGKKLKAELNLTTKAGLLLGGTNGPAAAPGKPKESLLLKAISYKDDELRMPPNGKLKEKDIAILTRWVEMGLPWPKIGGEIAGTKGFEITDEHRHFWAFEPVRDQPLPSVKDAAWPKTDLDRFILAALENKGLSPAKPADKRTLLRRATFDLTGLPPTPSEIDAFLKEDSREAFAKVIDRLLASPQYGERWGRHWLDVVRYADSFDSRGLGGVGDISEAWRYRDWVVDALNKDMPYDQFIIHQIAGDLLPRTQQPGGIIATGVLAIGNWGGGDADKEKMHTDIVDDQIDVVCRSFLGLTVTCARCHDHKFDPISTKDYYGLAGIFFSTHILPSVGLRTAGPDMLRISLLSPDEDARRTKQTTRQKELEKEVRAARQRYYQRFVQDQLAHTAKYLLAAWDYQNRPPDQAKRSIDEFAAERKLHEFALARWIETLTFGGEYQLMSNAAKDAGGKPGVNGYRGEPDCPSLLVNNTSDEVAIGTFKLPAKSVSVHPGPNNGVVVSWKSPVAGTVKITGKVVDADPQGGDGIAWIIDHRNSGGLRELASGDIPNAGAQDFAKGKGAEQLERVDIKSGDRIQLLVLPKANYICDTTVVELTISMLDGTKTWNLTADIVEDLHQGNPHADRFGNFGVWSFLDMAKSNRAKPGSTAPVHVTAWQKAAAEVASGRKPRESLEQAAVDFQKSFQVTDAASPFWINNPADDKHLAAESREHLTKLTAELDALKKMPLPPVAFAHGAQDGGIPGTIYAGFHDVKVHIRGSYLRLGDVAPRRFPEIVAGAEQEPIASGSGRLDLARWIARPANPLTARVMVNRIWQQHFGEGIVRTPSNFGKLGEPPTHPELLDHLAMQFVKNDWSIKKMHRLIMLSATYQQSSDPSPEALKLDPDNRLWSRMNRRRLEAEAIRDNILAVSGKLDLKPGGPATREFASPRRSLYQMTVRSDRSGFGPLFDTPDSTAVTEKRINSTVAPQALYLLNHPFILEQTETLSKRILAAAKDDRSRIHIAYTVLYGRRPSPEELQVGLEFLGGVTNSERGWEEYCQVLLCVNEFMYVD